LNSIKSCTRNFEEIFAISGGTETARDTASPLLDAVTPFDRGWFMASGFDAANALASFLQAASMYGDLFFMEFAAKRQS